jgi:hypothetical protein
VRGRYLPADERTKFGIGRFHDAETEKRGGAFMEQVVSNAGQWAAFVAVIPMAKLERPVSVIRGDRDFRG